MEEQKNRGFSKNKKLNFNSLRQDLLHVIYPNFCLICDFEMKHSPSAICPVCESELQYTHYEDYSSSSPLDELFWGRIHLEATYALLYFTEQNATRKILHQLKYKNRADLAQHMGEEIGRRILQMEVFNSVDALVPVPLHHKKEFIRGYNQAEELAKGIHSVTKFPLQTDILKRIVFTESQTKKGKLSRWENMQQKFSYESSPKHEFKHLAIIDDVVTTGSTIETCSRIIHEAYPNAKISIISLATAK
jgi:competence protein ComFC